MAAALQIPDLRTDIERAIEVVPPQWVDDDGIVALERRYDPLMFERFANGTLLISPLVGWATSARNSELLVQIGNWSRPRNLGIVTGPDGGIGFPDGALLAPDATFISRRRWNAMDRARTFAYAVPDAAFELLSKSDRIVATRRKMRTYLRNGVLLAVLIDCERRHVYVGKQGEESTRDLGWIDRLDCAPAMPGFVLNLAAVCAASDVVGEDSGQDDRSGEGTGGHPAQT
jgi:Uma2 family endonuclease